MEKKQYSRRKFINECFSTGSMFVGAVIIPDSCNSNKSGEYAGRKISVVQNIRAMTYQM